ncbi:MAG: hypothetical protein FD168_1401 [Desulfobulbaceae bacterium]|nr:MAG: hypothetical protein FD168_1401 [Desulfobulbaceae bacterium]
MKKIVIKTIYICTTMLCFVSWSLAAEPTDLLNNMNIIREEQGVKEYFPGKITEITGPSMIISDKELNLTPNTIFYDENRNMITLNEFKKGDQILYDYDSSTFDLISLQKSLLDKKNTLPEKKQEEDNILTKKDNGNERKIKLTNGIYKN